MENIAVVPNESTEMQRFWPITTMTHANELLAWLVNIITSQFGIGVTQLWKYQLLSDQQSRPELLALALAPIPIPANILASAPVAALVKTMVGPQNQIDPRPVHNLFPDYLAVSLRRRGLAYCAGYCVEKELDLPLLERSDQFTRSKLILALFLGEPSQERLGEIRSFLTQALAVAEKRGFLRVHHVVPWNGRLSQLSTSFPLEALIPRRTVGAVSDPLTFSLLITDKSARRLYDAIDDHSTVGELANRTRLFNTEMVKPLQSLLKLEAIQLYEPNEHKEPEEPPITPNNALNCYDMANTLFAHKRYQEALEAYEQTILLDSDSVAAYNGMGDVLLQLGRHEEAEEAYKQAVLRSIKRIR
jgi:hypothetical protein